MTEPEPAPLWETAELVAALDETVVARLIARHPAEGWCRSCAARAPCSTRTLAMAAQRAARRVADRPAGPPTCGGPDRTRW